MGSVFLSRLIKNIIKSIGFTYEFWQLALLVLTALGLYFVLRSLQFESRRNRAISKFLYYKEIIANNKAIDDAAINTKLTECIKTNFTEVERSILVSEGFIQMMHLSI